MAILFTHRVFARNLLTSDKKSLKKELSSLIGLNIVKNGRPFPDGIFIKNIV